MPNDGEQSPILWVDSQEKRSGIGPRLSRMGFSIRTRKLLAGDYALPGAFLIERKEANDFVTSIMDGHLFHQAELLASQVDRPLVVLEGRLDEIYSGIDPEAIAGALSALVLFYGIAILPTSDVDGTARLIGRLLRHATRGLGYEIPMRTDKPRYDSGAALFLVEGLPCVGPGMARKLLKHFGTPSKVFAASADELRAVKGVGPTTSASILGALNFAPTAFRSTMFAPQ